MLVFIDESGDPGFKVAEGSSPIFVAAMVIIENSENARTIEAVVREAKHRLRVNPEFKFNKMSNDQRDGFFDAVVTLPFSVRSIVIQKHVIYSKNLQYNKENFYRFFVQQMMTHDDQVLQNARVVIDGSGDREFRKTLKSYLRRNLGIRLKDIKFNNSENDVLVQVADMCAGAIARSYRTDRAHASRWRQRLAPRIDDVWDFR